MKRSSRKAKQKLEASYTEIVAIIAILIISGLAAVGTQVPTQSQLAATFETLDAACLSGERGDMDIRVVGNSIMATAPIETPNPCYDVEGSAVMENGNIRVAMTTKARSEICIQCIGVVTGRVTIPDLAPGLYGFEITTPSSAALTTLTVS